MRKSNPWQSLMITRMPIQLCLITNRTDYTDLMYRSAYFSRRINSTIRNSSIHIAYKPKAVALLHSVSSQELSGIYSNFIIHPFLNVP